VVLQKPLAGRAAAQKFAVEHARSLGSEDPRDDAFFGEADTCRQDATSQRDAGITKETRLLVEGGFDREQQCAGAVERINDGVSMSRHFMNPAIHDDVSGGRAFFYFGGQRDAVVVGQ
jgi:hypothetical protein